MNVEASLFTEHPEVTLRPVAGGDRPFLLRVYAGTRADELALVDWPDDVKRAFVAMQFTAQDTYYREYYPGATFDVVLVDGVPAGRLSVDRWADEIRIVDVSLLPEYRNAGIGTALLRAVMAEAAASGRKVTIHVEVFNPARRLYDRLGFVPAADEGVYLLMEWASGDDGLVAHPPLVRSEGHEEEFELAEVGMGQRPDLLLDVPAVGGMEQQRERHPPDRLPPLGRRPVPGLLAGGEDDVDGFPGAGHGVERLPDQGGERLAGEVLEHNRHDKPKGGPSC